jgi:hypothetical protein
MYAAVGIAAGQIVLAAGASVHERGESAGSSRLADLSLDLSHHHASRAFALSAAVGSSQAQVSHIVRRDRASPSPLPCGASPLHDVERGTRPHQVQTDRRRRIPSPLHHVERGSGGEVASADGTIGERSQRRFQSILHVRRRSACASFGPDVLYPVACIGCYITARTETKGLVPDDMVPVYTWCRLIAGDSSPHRVMRGHPHQPEEGVPI